MSAIKPKRVQYHYIVNQSSPGNTSLLSGVALNAAVGLRTLDVQVGAPNLPNQRMEGGYAKLTLGVSYTRTAGAATAITATVFGSFDGVVYYAYQAHSVSAGVDTLSDYSITKAVAASGNFSFVLDNDNYTHIRVIFSGTGAGAGDVITVQAAAGCQ